MSDVNIISALKRTIASGLLLCFSALMLTGCLDEISVAPDDSGRLILELSLNTSSNASSTKALTVSQEDLISDLKILPFDASTGLLMADPFSADRLTFTEPGDIRKVRIALDKEDYQNKNVTFMLLGNVNGNSSLPSLTVGMTTKEDVLNAMTYTVSETWPIDNSRHFPMYGTVDVRLDLPNIYQTVWMLRALARVQFTVNDGTGLSYDASAAPASLFDLKEVYMYYTRTDGYFTPSTDYDNTHLSSYDLHMLGTFPQRTLENPISYTVSPDEKWSYLRSIYTPENPNVTPDPEAVVMVAGGSYKGGETTYYKVPFIDASGAYDIKRNWSYDFNIKGVSGPGKPTPEEALTDGVILDLEIKAWNEIAAREALVNSPYELDVDNSMIAVDHKDNEVVIQVNTTYADGWFYDAGSKPADDGWYSVIAVGEGSTSGHLEISINANGGNATRVSHFTIHAGDIVKQINLTQLQENTSNCYIASEPGLHGLNATVMGNGTYGTEFTTNIYNKGKIIGTKTENIAEYMSSAVPGVYTSTGQIIPSSIASAEVIWQTRPGLITAVGAMNEGDPVLDENGTLKYMVGEPLDENDKGGNALIGIKDSEGNVIWSWHIWVIWGYEPEANDLHFLTSGVRSGFFVMDRNLGAMENVKGTADSYGLLYQWGRKDPMRGTSATSVPYTFTPTYSYTGADVDYTKDNSERWHAWSGGTQFVDILSSVRNPMNYSTKWGTSTQSTSSALWGNPSGKTIVSGTANKNNPSTAPFNGTEVWEEGKKSIYDPCPLGYRVPSLNGFYFGISNEMANVVHYNYNFTTGIEGAEVYPYSYCDVDKLGYSIYYFGQYKDYEKYFTWMPMAPYYAGTTSELISPMAGSEGFAYTWLNCSDSQNASQDGMCIPWHPINHHIHVYGEYSIDRYNAGTVRCVRETDPYIIAATVPEKIVLLADSGSSMSFDVLTNRDWHIETNNLTYGWVSAEKDPDNPSRVNTMTLAPNLTGESREGLIYVVLSSGEKYPVRIIQESVSIGSSELILGNAQGATLSKTFNIPTGGSLTLPSAQDDLFSYALSNSGQTYTLTVTTRQANASPNDLESNLALQLSDGTKTYPLNVTVIQQKYSITTEPISVAATANSKNTISFIPPTGSTVTLPVTDDGWFKYGLTKTEKGGVTTYTLTVTAKNTNYGAAHTETPVIRIGGYDYSVFVTQASMADLITYEVKGTLPAQSGSTAQIITLKLNNKNYGQQYTYLIDGMPEWCTFDPLEGPISNNEFHLTTVATNTNITGAQRSGTVEIKILYNGDDVRTIEGAVISQQNSNLTVTGSQRAYNYSGELITFKNANGFSYRVTDMPDWLSLNSTTGSFTTNNEVKLQGAITKPSVVQRTGYVTFMLSENGSDVGEVVAEITQTSKVVVNGKELEYSADAKTIIEIKDASGYSYEITSYPEWLTVTSGLSGNINNNTWNISGRFNEAYGSQRKGDVTIHFYQGVEDAGQIVVQVTQKK